MRDVVVSTPAGALQSRFRAPSQPDGLVVVMLGGLLSDQLATHDSRAQVLDQACLDSDAGALRFNYTAHGWEPTTRSTGNFRDVSITRMIDDALHVIEHYTLSKIAFAASSIGAGLLPYLLERPDRRFEVASCFTISAVSPDSLELFVAGALHPLDRERLANGDDVELRSPTLPVSIQVHRAQMEDLVNYRDLSVTRSELSTCRPRVLCAANDTLSSLKYNEVLACSLGGTPDDVVVIDSDHDIPFGPMLKEFRQWLNSLKAY